MRDKIRTVVLTSFGIPILYELGIIVYWVLGFYGTISFNTMHYIAYFRDLGIIVILISLIILIYGTWIIVTGRELTEQGHAEKGGRDGK